ncbi:hypothetical protein F2Q70_00008537 [Brassica cretica]|uniref:Uncharacterized protein n=2 Tax=Brassica cretica TaxID=69181 RepID=A0A8S9JA28_BRACR|nr:hypothetical protein F2Q68_00001582 [Brassica cretica]KAF2611219.1 hypothetical protein F2Q70_00008537 [Brassica cretica]KAF3545540.1 hypothetical protein DY000_02002050 [Brassica cretica]
MEKVPVLICHCLTRRFSQEATKEGLARLSLVQSEEDRVETNHLQDREEDLLVLICRCLTRRFSQDATTEGLAIPAPVQSEEDQRPHRLHPSGQIDAHTHIKHMGGPDQAHAVLTLPETKYLRPHRLHPSGQIDAHTHIKHMRGPDQAHAVLTLPETGHAIQGPLE